MEEKTTKKNGNEQEVDDLREKMSHKGNNIEERTSRKKDYIDREE